MKTSSNKVVPITIEPDEEDIRAYAYHLFEQSGCVPGHDLDNWLEARACIEANIPSHHVHARLHRHMHHRAAHTEAATAYTVPNIEAQNLAS